MVPAEEWVELANGCLCCSVKSDFVAALEGLMLKRDKFDYILIETTGSCAPNGNAHCHICGYWAYLPLHCTLTQSHHGNMCSCSMRTLPKSAALLLPAWRCDHVTPDSVQVAVHKCFAALRAVA